MDKNMRKHVRIVSTILMALGVLYLLAAGFVTVVGFMATSSQTQTGDVALLPAILTGGVVLFPLVLLGVSHIVIAMAFRAGKGWSRIALWILSVLNLGNVPVGTGVAIYAIWVLIQTREEVAKIHD
jgi:hypothetical protein